MTISKENLETIIKVDNKVKNILMQGGSEIMLLTELHADMPDIKKVIEDPSPEKDKYCRQYDGFYKYMKILENLAGGIANLKL